MSDIIMIWPKPDLKALDKLAKGQREYYRQNRKDYSPNGRKILKPKY